MKTPTEVQIIKQDGKPAFAVLPYDHYLALVGEQDGETAYIPHAVVGLCIEKGLGLLAAWRIHKGLSQAELAERMGVSQPAVAQMEKADSSPQKRTLQKAARALGISMEQLMEP
jgi:DNA-binding XRE family transcriptional regulator